MSTHRSSWLAGLAFVVGGEAAAAVDRHLGVRHAEQPAHRQAQQLALEVPQRGVDRRDRAGRQAGPSVVADRLDHRLPTRRRCRARCCPRRPARAGRRPAAAGAGRVGVADAAPAAGRRLGEHQRGRRPGQRAVGFRRVGRDLVDRRGNVVDRHVVLAARSGGLLGCSSAARTARAACLGSPRRRPDGEDGPARRAVDRSRAGARAAGVRRACAGTGGGEECRRAPALIRRQTPRPRGQRRPSRASTAAWTKSTSAPSATLVASGRTSVTAACVSSRAPSTRVTARPSVPV